MESVCCFGPNDQLMGIVSDPIASQMQSDAPAVLFLNAGLLPHVGPFCWYTTLARRLSDSGATTFRFDLAGVGESPPRNNHRDNLDNAICDVQDAMDFLSSTRSIQQFVLFGLCSGAVLAHHVSARDRRVVGVVAIDGISYPTRGFRRRQLLRRLARPKSWITLFHAIWNRWPNERSRSSDVPSNQQLLDTLYYRRVPREEIRDQMVTTMKQGMRQLQIYTQTASRYFNHVKQFHEMFGDLPDENRLLEVDYLTDADHMFSNRIVRQKMFERVESWYWRCYTKLPRSREKTQNEYEYRNIQKNDTALLEGVPS